MFQLIKAIKWCHQNDVIHRGTATINLNDWFNNYCFYGCENFQPLTGNAVILFDFEQISNQKIC